MVPGSSSVTQAALLLEARDVDKTFGVTRALVGASLALREGEIHALLGANGAGKSTLSKVIAGHVRPDRGTILHHGRPVQFRSAREALDAGISIVMQETTLAPDLSVLENIFLPELGKPGRLSFKALRARGTAIVDDLGHAADLALDATVRDLSAAQRQLVEIAKALALDAGLIIFDEPTASLSPSEVERLFDIMRRLKARGHSLIFVSHRLEEVFEVTDRVTVMREGRTVAEGLDTGSLTQADIIRHMVGRDIGAIYADAGGEEGRTEAPVVLEVEGIVAPPVVRGVSFTVRRGEILGLGGLIGAGRSETAEAIFGLRSKTAGTVRLDGRTLDIRTPTDAVRAGLGFVPEDRRVQNIVPDLSVRENLLLGHLAAHRGFWRGYRQWQAKIDELLRLLDLPAHRLLDANMLNFSGGMQQKIVIGRWLLLEPEVLILDEPTKGVDIGTRQSIYAILRRIAEQGTAVVVIASDFEELIGISSRVTVISDGRSIADVPAGMLDVEKLTLLAAPRTSMQRNTQLLDKLAHEVGGAAFWTLIEGDRIICLDAATAEPAAAPGFAAGDVIRVTDSAIPAALERREGGFVTESDARRSTLVVPIRNRRGHDLGWVGVTVPGRAEGRDAKALRQEIEAAHG